MLTCDVCCRCVRLIFTVEGLKACLEIIRGRRTGDTQSWRGSLETGLSVIVHDGEEEEEEEVPVPPPRRTSLRPPPRTSSLKH